MHPHRVLLIARDPDPLRASGQPNPWHVAHDLAPRPEVRLVTLGRHRPALEALGSFAPGPIHFVEGLRSWRFEAAAARVAHGLVDRGLIDVVHSLDAPSPRQLRRLAALGVALVVGPLEESDPFARPTPREVDAVLIQSPSDAHAATAPASRVHAWAPRAADLPHLYRAAREHRAAHAPAIQLTAPAEFYAGTA